MVDNVSFAERRDAQHAALLQKRPKCCECGEAIQDEKCYEFRGELMCLECLEGHRRWTEDVS